MTALHAAIRPRLLSYTWGEDPRDDSEVTFELTARDGDVLFVLTHRRLGERAAIVNVAGGWHTHLGILVDHLNGRDRPPSGRRTPSYRRNMKSELQRSEVPMNAEPHF